MSDRELERFIERRARAMPEDRVGQEHANDLEKMWETSERRFMEERRKRLVAEWYEHHDRLACVFARMSEEHRGKAGALLDGPGRGGA